MAAGMEFEGKNVEQAVQKALNELKIEKRKLKYDVVSYGSTGIFGLVGAKKARIRVIVPKEGYKKSLSDTETKDLIEELMIEGFEEPAVEIPPESVESEPVVEKEPDERKADAIAEDPESVELGKNVLQKILDLITSDTEITTKHSKESIFYKITGGNASIIIGKRGQTIEAIQYLVEKIVNKQNESQRLRVEIDIEGYMEKRRNNLKRLGLRLAEKAKKVGKPVTISQLNAHDRRIVHITLKNDSGVRTQSVGDGYYRKLIIFPKKSRNRKKKASPQ
jgi:spoIIIJ-associated protein